MLLDGALTIITEADTTTVSELKGVRLNLATHPNEVLYLLQVGVIMKLWAHE